MAVISRSSAFRALALLATAVPVAAFGAGSTPASGTSATGAQSTALDPTLPVEVETGSRQVIGDGVWFARYLRAPQTVECLSNKEAQCRDQRLEVVNESKVDLLCKAMVPTVDGNSEERQVLVPQERTREVAAGFLSGDQSLKLRTVTCSALPPMPALDPAPPAGCRPEAIDGQGLEAFYPAVSRALQEEGPVTVYFKLMEPEGKATGIFVGQSSLSQQLDQAAMLYIANLTFKTACPKSQFRLRVRFKLTD